MADAEPVLFALSESQEFGERVSQKLEIPLSRHEERKFEDGEHKVRSLINVRKRDVFVIQSLYADAGASVNDKLCRLLFFVGSLKDAAAATVTVIAPYLCYARKDRKSQSRDPVTTRYVAALFEAVGTDRLLTMDVHSLMAFQNAFRCGTDHLEATRLFAEHFASIARDKDIVVVSPDTGGIMRAEKLQAALERRSGRRVTGAFMEKHRAGGVVTSGALVGQVRDRTAIIFDDLISSGGTMVRAAKACQAAGARRVLAAATHGLFIDQGGTLLQEQAVEQVVVADTVPPFRLDPAVIGSKVVMLDSAGLFAEAIRRIHAGGSIVALMEQ